jgi:hypothetical protein
LCAAGLERCDIPPGVGRTGTTLPSEQHTKQPLQTPALHRRAGSRVQDRFARFRVIIIRAMSDTAKKPGKARNSGEQNGNDHVHDHRIKGRDANVLSTQERLLVMNTPLFYGSAHWQTAGLICRAIGQLAIIFTGIRIIFSRAYGEKPELNCGHQKRDRQEVM